jgi:hypothetical protein
VIIFKGVDKPLKLQAFNCKTTPFEQLQLKMADETRKLQFKSQVRPRTPVENISYNNERKV